MCADVKHCHFLLNEIIATSLQTVLQLYREHSLNSCLYSESIHTQTAAASIYALKHIYWSVKSMICLN